MNHTLKLSLQYIAETIVIATLWNQNDIRALVANFEFRLKHVRQEKWQEIEDKVIEKVPQLPLPESLKKEILGFIKPIGVEIFKWMEFHYKLLGGSYGKENLRKLCWTPQRTVDKKKTAEAVITDENVEIEMRYQLACIYCLEDDARELWNLIPERNKAFWNNEKHPNFYTQHVLVMVWTYIIKGEVGELNRLIKQIKGKEMSPYQYAFEGAAFGGVKDAAEYFLQKLTPNEKEESLIRSADYVLRIHLYSFIKPTCTVKEHYSDVLCFLLSRMNEEQHVKVFEKLPSTSVLGCFLDFPLQKFFMKTANRMWDFFPNSEYDFLLKAIYDRVRNGNKDWNYQTLLEEFWLKSSLNHKEYVIDEFSSSSLLSNLFKVEDKKNIALILKDATPAQKEKIILSDEGVYICEYLAHFNWDLLKFFINACITSQEKVIKLEKELSKRNICRPFKQMDMWNKLFQLLDDLNEKYNKKRGMEERNSCPTKRLCYSISEQC